MKGRLAVSRFIEPLGGPAPDEESPLRKFLRWLHPLDSIGSLRATLSGRGACRLIGKLTTTGNCKTENLSILQGICKIYYGYIFAEI